MGGRLYIVGTGPGAADLITPRAESAILSSRYVIGNSTYLRMIPHLLPGKEVIESSMGREVERAKQAVELAAEHTVSIVSGGDPGVYGMAGIVLEVLEKSGKAIPFEVIPGVTAATAAAARVGAPLTGDFVVISLSDLLTPWETIDRRLRAGFSMGIPVVLYNPKSGRRQGNLEKALRIAGGFLPGDTPVACVWNVSRKEERAVITTLSGFGSVEPEVDMHATVIVGCGESRIWRDGEDERAFITPRGYQRKYVY